MIIAKDDTEKRGGYQGNIMSLPEQQLLIVDQGWQ
jgi:hypothetical protein